MSYDELDFMAQDDAAERQARRFQLRKIAEEQNHDDFATEELVMSPGGCD